LEHPISPDHDHDSDWKQKGNKNADVGGRKSGPYLWPVTNLCSMEFIILKNH